MTRAVVRPLEPGEILAVTLPRFIPTGHEQEGLRPVVVAAIPQRPRYPTLVIVPLSATIGRWATDNPTLYPILEAGQGRLRYRSALLTDNVRGLDATREFSRIGALTAEQYAPVRAALAAMFNFGGET